MILSAKNDIPAIKDKTESALVDSVIKLMKASCTPAGTGMGKGVCYLPKAIGLKTLEQSPDLPNITVDCDDDNQVVKLTIEPELNTRVYYSVNKPFTVKAGGLDGVYGVKVASTTCEDTIDYSYSKYVKGNVVRVYAVAYNDAGIPSKVKTISISLNPYIEQINYLGQYNVKKGGSMQLMADVLPVYAKNKKIRWYTDAPAESGVSVSTTGRVTVKSNATVKNFNVWAVAEDKGQKQSDIITIGVLDQIKIRTLAIKKGCATIETITSTSIYAEIEPVDIYSYLIINGVPAAESGVSRTDLYYKFVKKAMYGTLSKDGILEDARPGSYRVCIGANDGGSKKVYINIEAYTKDMYTISIKSVDSKRGTYSTYVMYPGSSLKFTGEIIGGRFKDSRIGWCIYDSTKTYHPSGITVTNGLVKTTGDVEQGKYYLRSYLNCDPTQYNEATIIVLPIKITGFNVSQKSIKLCRTGEETYLYVQVTGPDPYFMKSGLVEYPYNKAVKFEDVNKSLVTITEADFDNNVYRYLIKPTGKGTGTTKLTIRANDGSNRKVVIPITVVNAPSGISINTPSDNSGVVCVGKSGKLNAKLEAGYGKLSSNKVVWEAESLPAGVTLSQTGVVTVNKRLYKGKCDYRGYYETIKIKASAADYSKVSKTIDLQIVNPTSKLVVYNGDNVIKTVIDGGKPGTARYYIYDSDAATGFAVSSSNSKVANAKISGDDPVLTVFSNGKGIATITVTALDGTGKKFSFKVKVK